MFGPNHYVPVLKVKRGEKKALQALAPSIASHLTPLLEIVEMDGSKPLAKHLSTSFRDLDLAVGGLQRFFLDAREIADAGPAGAQGVFTTAQQVGLPFVPVTGISRTVDVASALAFSMHGLALRITREDFESGVATSGIQAFLHQHGRVESTIDLLIDLGPVEQMVAPGIGNMCRHFIALVPNIVGWRSLSVISSAFPKSMGVVSRQSFDRAEWVAWRDDLHATRNALARLPTFGDCGIQHPAGVEGFEPAFMQVSATIRYALTDTWLLVKGESTDITPGAVQFPLLAQQIVGGALSGHFAGPAHCKGCEDMARAASGAPKFAAAEAWRRLGTIHHLTRTVEAIQSLPWP